jgi:hypothetical protein
MLRRGSGRRGGGSGCSLRGAGTVLLHRRLALGGHRDGRQLRAGRWRWLGWCGRGRRSRCRRRTGRCGRRRRRRGWRLICRRGRLLRWRGLRESSGTDRRDDHRSGCEQPGTQRHDDPRPQGRLNPTTPLRANGLRRPTRLGDDDACSPVFAGNTPLSSGNCPVLATTLPR